MDAVSAVCIGIIIIVVLIIFFTVCIYLGDHIQGPVDDDEE